jgi:uncharacterized protein (UPF0332 family)
MKQHKKILAQIALNKSYEAIKTSCENIDISLNTAQNRAYYAVFYVVSALAYLDDFVSKSHHYLHGQFNKRYIYENKVFDVSLIKIYTNLMKKRESSDYDFTYKPTKETVLKNIEDAKVFIEAVKPYIIEKLNKNAE